MRKAGHITILFFLLMLAAITSSGQIPGQIVNGLKSGDARAVSSYFNENVELVILDRENVCSQAQGEQILRDFFNKYKPSGFIITHQGGDDAPYAIGKMPTSGGNFRIYLLLKSIVNGPKIVQLRIERD
jgi:hypothetical protein